MTTLARLHDRWQNFTKSPNALHITSSSFPCTVHVWRCLFDRYLLQCDRQLFTYFDIVSNNVFRDRLIYRVAPVLIRHLVHCTANIIFDAKRIPPELATDFVPVKADFRIFSLTYSNAFDFTLSLPGSNYSASIQVPSQFPPENSDSNESIDSRYERKRRQKTRALVHSYLRSDSQRRPCDWVPGGCLM